MAFTNANLPIRPMGRLGTLPVSNFLPSIWKRIRWGFALTKQRHTLRNLSSHALRDIGVTSTQAHIEANRMAWDVPKNWRS